MLSGKPVLQHVIDAVRASGLPFHVEDVGHPGMGDSVAAAVRATSQANGWLVLPGDLPLIQPATLLALATQLMQADPSCQVVVPVFNGQRGHPVGFAAQCRGDLMALAGEHGAASVVKKYAVREVPVDDAGCTTDIDTVTDLEKAQRLLTARSTQ